jgi:nucleoside-diphosphate-sugar epimerase
MSKVLIIGAHGKVARQAAPRLAAAGHEVGGVIRKEEQSDAIRAAQASPVVADVEQLSTDEIAEVMSGYDTVVWSAGAGGGDPERTWSVDRDAAIRTIDAAAQGTPTRFVMVSYFGAGPDHGVPEDNDFYAYAQAKTEADEHLQGSDLDWTILRPSALTDEEPEDAGVHGIEVGDDLEAGEVPRAVVAGMIAAVVDRPGATTGRVLEFNGGQQSIDEVLTPAG